MTNHYARLTGLSDKLYSARPDDTDADVGGGARKGDKADELSRVNNQRDQRASDPRRDTEDLRPLLSRL